MKVKFETRKFKNRAQRDNDLTVELRHQTHRHLAHSLLSADVCTSVVEPEELNVARELGSFVKYITVIKILVESVLITMANFDQFQPDSTQGFDGDYDNDNDFERVDADRPLAMSDNPEEDRYASEQPEAQVPTADLLGSFGFGDGPAAAPAAPDYSSPGADDFGGFVEDPSVPDTTGSGSLGDFDHLQEIKPKEKVEEPKPVSQPPKPAPAATPTATSIAEKPTPSPRSQASPSVGENIARS